jgi:hypothetical protein|tara:strand:- start:1526 stop:2134 length:609 start_codon:yes stop_codon:yes gene_type:complete
MSDSPFSFGTKILGTGALILFSLLGLGVVLPATWEAEATILLPTTADAAFPYLDSPKGWLAWTPWPDSSTLSGPARGAGATMSWDDPEFGSGVFTIVQADAPRHVTYRVEVNDGRMSTDGTLELNPEGAGTRVRWREEGDLGRNPLMGYWALSMDGAQSDELQKSLDRLALLLVDSAGSVAADSSAAVESTAVPDSTDYEPS